MLVLLPVWILKLLGGDEFNKTKINENEFCLMTCQSMTVSKWSFLQNFRDISVKNKSLGITGWPCQREALSFDSRNGFSKCLLQKISQKKLHQAFSFSGGNTTSTSILQNQD